MAAIWGCTPALAATTESVFHPTTFAGHGESFQTPQDFGQPHNSYMPAIWGGDDTLFMLPGFQTQSTSVSKLNIVAGINFSYLGKHGYYALAV
jgi:hypothetical protein